MTAHRLAAIAAVFSLVVAGVGCNGAQSGPETVASAKPDAASRTPDVGTKAPDAGSKPARDAGAPNAPAGKPDASTTTPDAATTPATPPPTTGTGGTTGAGGMAGTGGTTPPATGAGGTTPPATGTGGTTPPVTGTGGSAAPPTTPPVTPPTTPPVTPPTTPPVTPPTTPPTTPPPATALRIAAIGDYGEDVAEEGQVANLVKSWKPDQVITLGDNNYQSGEASTIDANIGKYYHDFIGNYRGSYGAGSATNKFWPSPGNHDWVAPNLTPYTDYFTLPGNERYYDVDFGLVHLYAMDSDEHEPDGNKATSKQALWLKDKLASSKSCYDLVYFHYPAYSTGDHGSDTDLRWPFETWGAEAVLSGHDHSYERFQVGGIPYFVNGLGAAGIYKFTKSALPETKLRYDAKHGAMLITATPTGITFEFWTYDGQKIDSWTVAKNCG